MGSLRTLRQTDDEEIQTTEKKLMNRLVGAIEFEDYETFSWLVGRVRDLNRWAYNLYTPLTAACETRTTKFVKALLQQNVGVNVRDGARIAPIMVAMENPRHRVGVQIAERLLDKGSKINVVDNGGKTPLMYAAGSGNQRGIELLLAAGADLNITDVDGKTALILAVWRRNHAALKTLLRACADLTIEDNDGLTAFDYASKRYWKIRKLLESYQ